MPDTANRDLQPRIVYPFIIGVYPPLALYAANVQEVLPNEAMRSIAACLAFAALLWIGLAVLIRSRVRRGAVHLAVLAAVFGYGHYMRLFEWIWSAERGAMVYFYGPALLITAEVAFYYAYRWLSTGDRALNTTRFLNRFAVAVVLLATGTAAFRHYEASADLRRIDLAHQAETVAAGSTAISRPDVYVLMLDAYGGVDLLRDFYNFDNEPFLQALEQRGFYVARKSRANYPSTKLSLPASLNMEYLQDLLGPNTIEWKVQGDLVRHSRVAREFKARGYQHVTFETGYAFTETPNADIHLRSKETISDFDAFFLDTTLAAPLLAFWQGDDGESINLRSHRTRVQFILDQLKNLPLHEDPMFVYAHILCPHLPFAFQGDGSPREVDWQVDLVADGYRPGYIEQIRFLNVRVLEAVDAIQKRSPGAVIVIQGDHGPRLLETRNLKAPWVDYAREHLETINAFYFPGETEYTDLYENISQVNTFRVIFNRYFGTNYELLPDISYLYFQDRWAWLTFTPVRWTENGPEIIGDPRVAENAPKVID